MRVRAELAGDEEYLEDLGEGDDIADLLYPGSPMAPVHLALWQFRSSWRLLITVGLGILVAVVLTCTVPLYSSLVANVQVQQQLSVQHASDLNIEIDTTLAPILGPSADNILTETQSSARHYLQGFAPTSSWYLALETYLLPEKIDGAPVPVASHPLPRNPKLLPYVLNYQQALSHMIIRAGRLPEPTAPNQMPEILVNQRMGIQPGDTLSIDYRGLTMKVVGVWSPRNTDDPYWNGSGVTSYPFLQCHNPVESTCPPAVMPILFDRQAFFAIFGANPSIISTLDSPFSAIVHQIAYTIPSRITTATISEVISGIRDYKAHLDGELYRIDGVVSVGVATQLDTLLNSLRQQAGILAQPLYIVVAQVIGLALLDVLVMVSLLIEDQAGLIATLRCRGASRAQVALNYVLQGLLISAMAALAGPFIASGLSLAIVRYFVPAAARVFGSSVASSNLTSLASAQVIALPALVGALLGLVTMVVVAWFASRREILAVRRESGRGSGAPWWKRTYLDLALALLCAAGYLDLGEFGGLNVRQQLSQSGSTTAAGLPGADLLQLAAPLLLLLGGGLLALRLFPWATSAGSWLASRAPGAIGQLVFTQLSRSGATFSRLTLLLTLTVGLGVFSLTFQQSIRINAVEQAQYLAGCDQRVVLQSPVEGTPPTAAFEKPLATMPGVLGISPVYRTEATNPIDNASVNLLGIDPASFPKVAYWSAVDAQESLAALMQRLLAHEQGVAAGDQGHPIWALIDASFARHYALQPRVRFRLTPADSSSASLSFVVGAVVDHFPTLSDAGAAGFVVLSSADYANALNGPQGDGGFINYIGPNEFWLHTNGNASEGARRAQLLLNPDLWVAETVNRSTLEAQALDDPLISGMVGLLLAGIAVTLLLAILGSITQSAVVARQQLTQLAILRTLGGQRSQLFEILLSQQVAVYLFSIVLGTMLGLILSTATVPFLEFSTSTYATVQGLPPYQLAFNLDALPLFYGVLAAALLLTLLIDVRAAIRGGLGRALRIGEDIRGE